MENNLVDIKQEDALKISKSIILKSDSIFTNEKEDKEENGGLFWEKFFIREEFLKLYFQNLGINSNLKTSKLTNFYDIKRKESNEKFLFSIIRYNIIDENLLEEGIKTDLETIYKDRLNLFYPENHEIYDPSTNYLSLAISGFANISQSKIFTNKEKETSYLKVFFDEVFSNKFEEKEKFPKWVSPNFNDKLLKNNNYLNKKHNDFIKDLIGEKLEKIPKNNRRNDYFSLIFYKDGSLYEFLSHNQEVIEIKKNINESMVREVIMRYLMDNNEKRELTYKYLNDITIFLEFEKEEITEINTESEGAYMILLTTILFISNFLLVNSGNTFYDFNVSVTRLLEYDLNGTYLLTEQKISSFKDVFNYYDSTILKKIYDTSNNYQTEINRYMSNDYDLNSEDHPKNITEIDLDMINFYPLSMNYFCGMLMNFKLSNDLDVVFQSDGDRYVIKKTETNYYGGRLYEFQNTSVIFDYYYDENPLSGSSFSFYYKPIINENQKEIQSAFMNYIIQEKIIFFSYSIIFYNPIHNVALIYYRQFDLTPFGQIQTSKKVYGFSPFPNTTLFAIISINSLYLLGLLYIAFIVIRNFSHQLLNTFNTKSFTFEIYELIDLTVLSFNIISTIFFFSVFNFVSIFPIALTDKQMFLQWINYGLMVNTYLELTGFTMFLLILRLVRFLYTSFPNFGIVFQTLNNARHELFAFVFMMFLILIGFFIASHVCFGSYSIEFFDIFDSFLEIYTMILGSFEYENIIGKFKIYSPVAPYFFIFYMLFFNSVLFNVFLSIILYNYGEIKRKNQKVNEAYALLIEEKSYDFQNKLLNFFFCKNPYKEGNDTSNNDNNAKPDEMNEEMKVKIEKKKKKFNFFTKLKMNYENLNISQIFSGSIIRREELEQNLKSKLVEIDRKNIKESISELEVDNEREFDQLYDTVCYIIFIIIFIGMILVQLRLGISSEIRLISERYFSEKLGSQIIASHLFDSKKAMSNFIGMFYNATSNDTCENLGNTTPKYFNQTANDDYIFTKPPYFRLTVRIFKYELNSENIESKYFPLIINNPHILDKDNCGNDEKIERILINEENSSGTKYLVGQLRYFNKGDPRTPFECGGYVYFLNNTNPFCKEFYNKRTYNYTLNDFFSSLSSQSAGSLILDSVLFNTYYRFIIYLQFSITQSLFGDNQFNIEVSPIPINLISNDLDNLYRMLLEIIYYFFITHFYIIKIKEILEHLDNYLNDDMERDPEKEKFKEIKSINRYFRFEFRNYENIGLLKALGLILFRFISRVCQFVIYLFQAFIDHLRTKFFNIIDLISLLISLILIIQWIKITTLTHSLDLKFEKLNFPEPLQNLTEELYRSINESEEKFNSYTTNNIMIANQLNEMYKSYIYWMGVNSFIILISMIQYFKFSKSVYNLVLILDKARNSIIFHFILMMFFLIGFALWGFAIFGHSLERFRSITRSLLELFLILIGNINTKDFSQNIWGILFLILFCIIMILIILNVLTSIIIETYKESKKMQSQNIFDKKPMNLIDNIIYITKMKYFIFINTIDNYIKYIRKFRNKIFEDKCYKPFSSSIEELDNENKGILDYCSDYVFIMERFYNEFNKYQSFLEDFTLEKNFSSQKLPSEILCLYQKNNNSITKSNEISICTKIVSYILLKITDSNYYSSLNIQNLNVNLEFKNVVTKSKSYKNQRQDKKNLNFKTNETNKLIDLNLDNKYLKEFSKRFFNSFSSSTSSDFIKKDLFIKGMKLSYNKRASKGIINLNSHLESYCFQKHKKKREYNTNFILNCSNHRNITKHNKFCDKCLQMREYFDSIYIFIYDLLVKYYYLPKNMEIIEKALYLGFFINRFSDMYGFKNDINFYLSKISKEKLKLFQEDLTKFINFESFEMIDFISFCKEEYLKKNKNNKSEEEDINLFSENDIKRDDENAGDTLIMQLYKSFCIWNALYIIIFKKFPEFVRKIKRKSFSYTFMENIRLKVESKIEKPEMTPFSELVTIINSLDKYTIDKSINADKLLRDVIITNFYNYISKIKKKIEDIDLGERNFFEQDNKFFLDDIDQFIYSDPIPKDLSRPRNEEKYPNILIDIWRTWKKKNKFYIFFGFNSNLASNEEMNSENFLKNDFMNMPKIEIYIYKFFTNRHKAEIFKQSSFPNYFMKFLIVKFKDFLLKNHISDQVNQKIESVQDIVGFFHDMRLNYMVIYRFFMESFDSQFSKLKEITTELDTQFTLTFNKIKKTISNDENGNEFMKLYKLFISKAKFEKLSYYFEKYSLNEEDEDVEIMLLDNNKTNRVPQKSNEESNSEDKNEISFNESPKPKKQKYDNFISNEIFILFFSMDCIELVDIIRSIDDELLKEFYMFLLIYLNEGNDFTIIYQFLERKAQFHLIQKYKFYSNYLMKRDESTKAENLYIDEKNRIGNFINYISYLRERLESLNALREKTLNSMTHKIKNHLNTFSND